MFFGDNSMEMDRPSRWTHPQQNLRSGIYYHYSTPRVVSTALHPTMIRQWAHGGDVDRLELVVLEGQGERLMEEPTYEPRTHNFMKVVPQMIAKCKALHEAVMKGSLADLRALLQSEPARKKFALCKDPAGVGLLHKAVYYGYQDIAMWLIENFSNTVHQRDSEGRTPLHYAAVNRSRAMASMLERAGADTGARDSRGRNPAHYRAPAAKARLVLPQPPRGADMTANKRGMVFRHSNLRIWCHDCDMGQLQKIVWEGLGNKLLLEMSNQPIVKRFLEAVPFIMNTIKQAHAAVIAGDTEELKKVTEEPVASVLFTSKDPNGLTVLHKAAGLGHDEMVEYIVGRHRDVINQVDNDGRTPLFYAAANPNSDSTFQTLVNLGAKQELLDDKEKSAAYYINRPNEIDRTLLTVIPNAPRKGSGPYPPLWDWKYLKVDKSDVILEKTRKTRRRHKSFTERSSKNGTETVTSPVEVKKDLKATSTQEFIKSMPDLTENVDKEKPFIKALKVKQGASEILTKTNFKKKRKPTTADVTQNEEMKTEEENQNVGEDTQGADEKDNMKNIEMKSQKDVNPMEGALNKLTEPVFNGNSGIKNPTQSESLSKSPDSDNNTNERIKENKSKQVHMGKETPEDSKNSRAPSEESSIKGTPEIDSKGSDKFVENSKESSKKGTPESNKSGETSAENSMKGILKEKLMPSDNIKEIANKNTPKGSSEITNENIIGTPISMKGTPRTPPKSTDLSKESSNANTPKESPQISNKSMIGTPPAIKGVLKAPSKSNDHSKESTNVATPKESPLISEKSINGTPTSTNNPQNKTELKPNSRDTISQEILERKSTSQDSKKSIYENVNDSETSLVLKKGTPSNSVGSKSSVSNESDKSNRSKTATKERNTVTTDKDNIDDKDDDDDVKAQGDGEYSRSTNSKRDSLTSRRGTQESLMDDQIFSRNSVKLGSGRKLTDDANGTSGEIMIVRRDETITDDAEVAEMVNSGNMELLAGLVLNGEGSRLLGRTTENKELQAFIDNVPTYMKKINRVHIAAKEGNIRDLQAALDRRKFAIARDPISPNGATPLHVATIYGKTNIMKYLGGRFPETLSAVDFEGRTALHYAAVLPDNGHYYNLLQHIGANAKDVDDNGVPAEEYFKNEKYLTYKDLLTAFGIDEGLGNEMFADRVPNDQVSSRRELEDPEVLNTLERCYTLLNSNMSPRTNEHQSASSNRGPPPKFLGKFLRRPIFDSIKTRITKLDHDLFDVIWPAVKKIRDCKNIIQTVEEDFPGGVMAPDYYVYDVFEEFLIPLIKDLHNAHFDLYHHPPSDFVNEPENSTNSELVIDPNGEYIISGRFECARNIDGYELPHNLNIGQLETVERFITEVIMNDDFMRLGVLSNPESDQKKGSYYTLNEVLDKTSEIYEALASSGLLVSLCDKEEIDDTDQLHGRFWPYGRGVYLSDDRTMAVWVNVQDHLRLLITTPQDAPGEIGFTFTQMSTIMTYVQSKLKLKWDSALGFLTCRPTFLGCSMRINLLSSFPNLCKDIENMKMLCSMRGLELRETIQTDVLRISNHQCLGVGEVQCFKDFSAATANLIQMENNITLQNESQISTMLSNIFKRKRSSFSSEAAE